MLDTLSSLSIQKYCLLQRTILFTRWEPKRVNNWPEVLSYFLCASEGTMVPNQTKVLYEKAIKHLK